MAPYLVKKKKKDAGKINWAKSTGKKGPAKKAKRELRRSPGVTLELFNDNRRKGNCAGGANYH